MDGLGGDADAAEDSYPLIRVFAEMQSRFTSAAVVAAAFDVDGGELAGGLPRRDLRSLTRVS